MRRRRITAVAAGTSAATAILLCGCGGGRPSEKQQALKSDPIAAYAPPGGKLVESHGRNEGSTLGKPVYASYRRLFELPPGDPERQLRDAVDAAAAAGWQFTESKPFRVADSLSQAGRKRLPTGVAELTITVFPHGPPSGGTSQPALLVLLTHTGS